MANAAETRTRAATGHANGRKPLARQRILETALLIVDEQGLHALSMRKLASHLGVEAMSLYNHIENKDDILDGLADLVFREVAPPSDVEGDWQQRTREIASAAWCALSAHPNVLPVVLARCGRAPGFLRLMEAVLQTLRRAGFDEDLAHHAWHSLRNHVLGYVPGEAGSAGVRGARARTAHRLPPLELTAEDFPAVVEVAPYLARCNREAEFDFGLDVILTGLHAKLPHPPVPAPAR